MKLQDGYYLNDLVVWNSLDRDGWVSKGYSVTPPDLKSAGEQALEEFQDRLRGLFSVIKEPARMQWQWRIDSDYHELHNYDRATDRLARNELERTTRKERFTRYMARMKKGALRRERLYIYISIPVPTKRSENDYSDESDLAEFRENTLKTIQGYFQRQELTLNTMLGNEVEIRPMTDRDHFCHHAYFFNPTFANRFDYDPEQHFDPHYSVLSNNQRSGFTGNLRSETEPYSFFSDGYYHNIMVIRRWPRATFPGLIYQLTRVDMLDYAITLNLSPRDIYDEIRKEEKIIERLEGDYRDSGRESLAAALNKRRQKVHNLSTGYTFPVTSEYYIRVWARSTEELESKTASIKAACELMEGAQLFETSLSTEGLYLYSQTVPGWIFGKNNKFGIYGASDFMADMIPFSATFTGNLAEAEALYDGDSNNIVGVTNFTGSQPQHAAMFGMSGAGKSAFMVDMLTQTSMYYDYTVIIEEGMSYGLYTVGMEELPIIVQPDNNLTINYFDTHGLPLTSRHKANAAAFVSRMCGDADSSESGKFRHSMLLHYINETYLDAWEEWAKDNPAMVEEISRFALGCDRYTRKVAVLGSTTPIDMFLEFKENLKDPEFAQAYLHSLSSSDVHQYMLDDSSRDKVREIGYAWFGEEDFPIHTDLINQMNIAPSAKHKLEDVQRAATLLSAWAIGGTYGCLFDGATNVKLTGRVAHFELGFIGDGSSALKEMAAFLITNYTRSHIMSLSRKVRKRIIFEEAGRTLNMPGGEEMISEGYAQMRKYMTWIIAIVQQYHQFKSSRVRPTIMGNSKQFYMLKQHDVEDLKDLCDRNRGGINLPAIVQDTIMKYPGPETLPVGNRFSSLTYYHLGGSSLPIAGTIRQHCSPEMLLMAGSSGEDFEKLLQELKKLDSASMVSAFEMYVNRNVNPKEKELIEA